MLYERDRKFSVFTGFLLLIPIFQCLAQAPVYTLRELIDSATHNYPQLLQKQAMLNSAEAAVTDARHRFLPTLNANEQIDLGTDNSIPGSYVSYGIIPSAASGVRKENNSAPASGNIAILSARYNLIDFGYRQAYVNQARSSVRLCQADLEQAIYRLKLQAARLYFTLLKNQFRLLVNKQNVDRYQNIFTVIRALTNSGIKPGSDSSLAKAEWSKSRILYNQTRGQILQTKEQLAFLTGISAENFRIDTSARSYIRIRSALSAPPANDAGNPLLSYYQSRRNNLLAQQQLISKAYSPRIVLSADTWARGSSITYDDRYQALPQGLGYQRLNYLAGISFQYDLFNGIHKRDQLNISRYRVSAGALALEEEKRALRSAGRQAADAIQTAETNLSELPVQLTAAGDVYDQKLAQYKAGLINLVDLTNAAFVLDRSQNDYIETLADWYMAQLDKAWTAGNVDPFINAIK